MIRSADDSAVRARQGDRGDPMKRRQLLIALGAGAIAAPLASFAQQPAKVARIGFLGLGSAADPGWSDRVEALRAGLRDLGYVEGKHIVIELLWAEGKYERLPELVADLVRSKVDVIVTHATPGTRAAKEGTATIPIVAATVSDPVETGLVASLARPGGNVTGSTIFFEDTSTKRLEFLKEVFPLTKRAAVLIHPENASMTPVLKAMHVAANTLKIELHPFAFRRAAEIESAFSAMHARNIDGIVLLEEPMQIANVTAIADYAARRRLPSIGFAAFAEAGGLIAYGVNLIEMYRRAAYFVDRILKGAKPGDLPFERATKFELVINLKTAKTLGIKIPQQLLLRADKVIE
jgi:ABC-type uncharacterized transport system substrate-binding protein